MSIFRKLGLLLILFKLSPPSKELTALYSQFISLGIGVIGGLLTAALFGFVIYKKVK